MATGDPVVYLDFTGGLRLDEASYMIRDNECFECADITTHGQGALSKRHGWDRLSIMAPLDTAHTLFPVNLGANNSMVAIGPDGANDKAVRVDSAGVSTALTLNAPLTSLTANKRWEFAQGPMGTNGTLANQQGPFYGINGVDRPMQWTGVAGDPLKEWTAWAGTVPRYCKYLIYHLDQFWATGDPNNPGRVFRTGTQPPSFSTPLPDPCNWDSAFIDDVEPYDGQENTALGKVGPYLIVFKARSMYVLSEPNSGVYRKVSSQIGCSAHRSVVETAQGTVFYSDDVGVCITDGSDITVLSDAIEPLLRDIADTFTVATKNAVGTYWEGSYYLSLPGLEDNEDAVNTITLEYKFDTKAWWIHTCTANDYAILDPAGAPKLYAVDPTRPLLQRCFVPDLYTDSGYDSLAPSVDVRQGYTSYWRGPYWSWGNPHLNKRIGQFRIDGRGSWTASAAERFATNYRNMDFVVWEDGTVVSTTTFGGSGTFGPPTDDGATFGTQLGIRQLRYPTPVDGWGRAWSIKVSDDGAAAPFDLYSIAAFIRPRKD